VKPDEEIVRFRELTKKIIDKLEMLSEQRVDSRPTLRNKWIAVERSIKIIGHKAASIDELTGKNADDLIIAERALDRAIKAAELLDLELDEV